MANLVTVRIRRGRRRTLRLWIPVLPVLLVLSPVLVIAAPVLAIGCLAVRVNPVRAFLSCCRLLGSAGGTRFELDTGDGAVLVTVR